MRKAFNVAGPCVPGKHYMLPALDRLGELPSLIDGEQYFVLHAARQTGKTTALLDLRAGLEDEGTYRALYVSFEEGQGLTDPSQGIPACVRAIGKAVSWQAPWAAAGGWSPIADDLEASLVALSAAADRPLVLLIDEADCLSGQTMITALRQLRSGFVSRQGGAPFPHSLALVGMRDIRDYRALIRSERDTLGSASPFNIVTKSLTLRNFTRDEVAGLYAQHTAATGQEFPAAVVDLVHARTAGQPWLVNAIARQMVIEDLAGDASRPITVALAAAAMQTLILRRDTHIDSLLERLREERVRKVVEPVILGEAHGLDMLDDDVRYCLDLGLLRSDRGVLSPACPIYGEVMLRALSWSSQAALPLELERRWMTDDAIDLDGLLREFQQFWRENADIWTTKYDYKEAAPHLILQAFLQRVVNGGAYIAREFATGRKRLDLDLQYAGRHHPIELKLYYGEKTRADGEAQLAAYCRSLGASDGWLIIFDRRDERTWDEKIGWDEVERDEVRLRVLGC